jgi:hypothetical protein
MDHRGLHWSRRSVIWMRREKGAGRAGRGLHYARLSLRPDALRRGAARYCRASVGRTRTQCRAQAQSRRVRTRQRHQYASPSGARNI